MEGFLFKKGRGDSSFGRRNWKRRWFVLEDQELYYFENFNLATDEPIISKGHVSIAKCSCGPVAHRQKQNTFVISPPEGNEIQLYAADSKTMNLWIKEITAAARGERLPAVIDYGACYETLGLSEEEEPSPAEINRAYRKAALKHHPDKGGDLQDFERIQAAFNGLMSKLEEEEYEAQHDTIVYQVLLKKQSGDTGLGLVVEEDSQKRVIKIKSVMAGIEIHSISSQAEGKLLPGDILLKVRNVEVLHMPLTRVAQKLNHFRVPVNTTVNLTFIRKVKKREFANGDDEEDDDESRYQSVDSATESARYSVISSPDKSDTHVPFSPDTPIVVSPDPDTKPNTTERPAISQSPRRQSSSNTRSSSQSDKYPELAHMDPVARVAILAENEELKEEMTSQQKLIEQLRAQQQVLQEQLRFQTQQQARKQESERDLQAQLYAYVYSGAAPNMNAIPGTSGKSTSGMALTRSEVQQSMSQLIVLSSAIEDLMQQGLTNYYQSKATGTNRGNSKGSFITQAFEPYATPEMEAVLAVFDERHTALKTSNEDAFYAQRVALLCSFLSDSHQTVLHQHQLHNQQEHRSTASSSNTRTPLTSPLRDHATAYQLRLERTFEKIEEEIIGKLARTEILSPYGLAAASQPRPTPTTTPAFHPMASHPILTKPNTPLNPGPILLNPTVSATTASVTSSQIHNHHLANHNTKPAMQFVPLASLLASQSSPNPHLAQSSDQSAQSQVPIMLSPSFQRGGNNNNYNNDTAQLLSPNPPVRQRASSSNHSVSSMSMLTTGTSTLAMPRAPAAASRFLQPTASSNQRKTNS